MTWWPRTNWPRTGHCIQDGCTNPILARRLCSMHYNRKWREAKAREAGRYRGAGKLLCARCLLPVADHSIARGCPR